MSGIVDCEMHIGDEVFVHGYIDEIRNDTIIIRNVGGYFGTSRDEVFYYEEDGTMNEAEQTEPYEYEILSKSNEKVYGAKAIVKTENCSEKPNNCEPQTYVINPQEPTNDDKCFECDDFFTCDGQCDEVETEPQTLDDISRQIQDAYDKGILSDAGAVQAWYEAVSKFDKDINVRSKTEPQKERSEK